MAKSHYRDPKVRMALAIAFMMHFYTGMEWQDALDAARKNKDLKQCLPSSMNKTEQQDARRVGKKLVQHGTVLNLPHTKKVSSHELQCRPPGDEYRLASFVLKSGYTDYAEVTDDYGDKVLQESNRNFSSLAEGMELSTPPLKSIYDKA